MSQRSTASGNVRNDLPSHQMLAFEMLFRVREVYEVFEFICNLQVHIFKIIVVPTSSASADYQT